MRKHAGFAIRVACFVLLTGFIVSIVNYILSPKKYYDDEWPTTATYKGFYQMQKDTIDVLFLGSSHAASSFNPQEVYNSYGIKSYNIGCEGQSVLVSYYWLKEAIKYQSPKFVVFDTFMLFDHNDDNPLNSSEACTRMAIDAMNMSTVKLNAANDICKYDNSQSFYSYIFKNIRFHSRWTMLKEQDFNYKNLEKHYELKGYTVLTHRIGNPYYEPNSESDYVSCGYEEMLPLMEMYLDKIVDLCNENNISLILVKTPIYKWESERHNTLERYASEKGIYFYDFNDIQVYEDSGLVYLDDMSDNDGHSNIWGAQKMSTYIAGLLYNSFGLTGGDGYEQWMDTMEYYSNIYEACMKE
jgi:hypothetical protein